MSLTDTQYAGLAADILTTNQAEFAARVAANDDQLLVDAYTLVASPDFWVWRTRVSKQEVVGMMSQDGTTFTWAGNGFITRSVGELMAWQELFGIDGTVNPSLPQVRQAFADIFSGAGNAAGNRMHLAAVGRRKATRLERLFASGSGSLVSPGFLVVEGAISPLEMAHAVRGVPL